MRPYKQFGKFCPQLSQTTMAKRDWVIFIRAFAVAFIAYWLHLLHGLKDWLGSEGYHLPSPAHDLLKDALPTYRSAMKSARFRRVHLPSGPFSKMKFCIRSVVTKMPLGTSLELRIASP